jgi:hypothetical protein
LKNTPNIILSNVSVCDICACIFRKITQVFTYLHQKNIMRDPGTRLYISIEKKGKRPKEGMRKSFGVPARGTGKKIICVFYAA